MSQLDDMLRALSHPIRREILWMVWDRRMAAGDIAKRFDVAGPTISAHLKALREAGLVQVDKEGTFWWYRARREPVQVLQRTLFSRGLSPRLSEQADAVAGDAVVPKPVARPAFEIAAEVLLPCDVQRLWAMWTDPAHMGWVGDNVTGDPTVGGTFGFDTAWGPRVRGIYLQLLPPAFLAMRWDFSSTELPLPPAENVTYLLFTSQGRSARLQVRQYVFDAAVVPILEAAWTDTLRRLTEAAAAV